MNIIKISSLASLMFSSSQLLAAGCVVSRGADMHHFMTPNEQQSTLEKNKLVANPEKPIEVSIAYRHFTSDRHFTGKHEEKHRQQEGSEVINHSKFIDIGFQYAFDELYSASLTIPFAFHDRSQVVRVDKSVDPARPIIGRYHTQAYGMADIRIVGNRWMFTPQTEEKGNVLLGIGLDLPTGEKETIDTFMKHDKTTGLVLAERRPVDQSIQLGDGGWGLILDSYGYLALTSRINGYIDATYTITPQETNGVKTFRTNPFEAEMSITDSYTIRSGIDYNLLPEHHLHTGLALRNSGVPVHDLAGGSDGFRRPGYDISLEPSASIQVKGWSFNLSVPYTIERNRKRSEADKRYTKTSGTYQFGDAAFADYEVIFSASKPF